MAGVSDWSATADENTTVDGINIAEHCPAKNMNDALRAVMAALKNKCDALDSTDNTLRRGAVIGEVRWFAMPTPPEGWLACNGAAVAISDYPALYNAIGTLFLPKGVPASPTTFNLPNLMGKVPWGSSSQVGTEMKAGLPNITGAAHALVGPDARIAWDTKDTTGGLTGAFSASGKYGSYASGYTNNGEQLPHNLQFDASRSSAIYGKSTTVQPPALCLLPCIRYE